MATKKVVKKTKKPAKSNKRQGSGKFKKGESGNPEGPGKGYKKAKTLLIEQKLSELNCDPIEVMATICNDKNEEPALRLHAAKELANYIYPKRKAVEYSGSIGRNNAEEMTVDDFANLSEEEKIVRCERDNRRNSEAIERAKQRLAAKKSASVQ